MNPKTILVIVITSVVLLAAMFFIYPQYNVWQRELAGKATLREAEWSRKVAIEEARAKKESAVMLGEAELQRAQYLARSIQVIGDQLQQNEEYLRYLWIQGLNDSTNQVIYIPTEAGLPLLEAGRMVR